MNGCTCIYITSQFLLLRRSAYHCTKSTLSFLIPHFFRRLVSKIVFFFFFSPDQVPLEFPSSETPCHSSWGLFVCFFYFWNLHRYQILCNETNRVKREQLYEYVGGEIPVFVNGSGCKDRRIWQGKDGLVIRWDFGDLDYFVVVGNS